MAAPMNPICLLNGFYTPLPQVLLLSTDGQMGFLINFPKWLHIGKETYLDRLCLRYEKEGRPSQLSPVDLFVSKVDPLKEPHLVTANTVLSILAVDYHVDKNDFVDDPGAVLGTMKANHLGMRWSLF